MTYQELMDQYQTQDKTTLSFAEYKKALEDYLHKYDALCGTGFAKYMAEYEDMLEEYYQDGLSVVGMGQQFNITCKKEYAREELRQEFYSLFTKWYTWEERRRIMNKHNNKSAREIAEELVVSRGLDWLGDDCENLVSDAMCSYTPEVVHELLRIYTAEKRSVSYELSRCDRDGISAFQIAKHRKDLWPVLEEFGIDMYAPDLLHHPAPWGSIDMCELHEQRVASGGWAAMLAIKNVATLTYKRHKGQFRKQPDGRPYIVHPQAVYEMMLGWGYVAKDDVVSLCVAWGHDIIEEAKPEEREMIEREIANAGGEWGDAVLAGIKSLSFVPPKDIPREEHDKMKAAYMESVAENASPDILVVKMADRLCNTLGFAKGDKGKARAYLAKGKCLFRRLDQMSHSEAIRKTLAEVESAIAY